MLSLWRRGKRFGAAKAPHAEGPFSNSKRERPAMLSCGYKLLLECIGTAAYVEGDEIMLMAQINDVNIGRAAVFDIVARTSC